MVSPWRSTKGVKPDALKGTSPVLNGGDEETGLCRPRFVATQLECGLASCGCMVSLVLKSCWLIAADPHRGRVHFITTASRFPPEFSTLWTGGRRRQRGERGRWRGAILARAETGATAALEPFDLALFADDVERLLATPDADVLRVLHRPFAVADYHLSAKCDGCPYNYCGPQVCWLPQMRPGTSEAR